MESVQKILKIPATYMRGGTSKGVFIKLTDLPEEARVPGVVRDKLVLRLLGSPDPYGKQMDGMGGATSSTSKVVIVSKSQRPEHDVDYLFGQVAIDEAFVDWSGNCGNLTAAVGAFAIESGLLDSSAIPKSGVAVVRIWQANISKTIEAAVPIVEGRVQEAGDFKLDGVAFPGAKVKIDFCEPADGDLFPSSRLIDTIEVPDIGVLSATLINAGIPTVIVKAEELGYSGIETQDMVNGDLEALAKLECIRAYGALKMGLIKDLAEAEHVQHTPKLVFVASPRNYEASDGKTVVATEIDLVARALSMGKLHHAMMGTAAVAIGAAGAIPGTVVNQVAGGGQRECITFGHPSGTLMVGAELVEQAGSWCLNKVSMNRSARVLMEGWVRVPVDGARVV